MHCYIYIYICTSSGTCLYTAVSALLLGTRLYISICVILLGTRLALRPCASKPHSPANTQPAQTTYTHPTHTCTHAPRHARTHARTHTQTTKQPNKG